MRESWFFVEILELCLETCSVMPVSYVAYVNTSVDGFVFFTDPVSLDIRRRYGTHRPHARVEEERRRQVARRTGHGDQLRLAARFHPNQIALLDIVGVLRRQRHFGQHGITVGVDVAQHHAVQRRLVDVHVLQDLVLELREDGVAAPRIVGEDLVVVLEAHRRARRRVAVFGLVLELVQRREVVRLERLVARSAGYARSAHALATRFVAHGADSTAHVAAAVLAPKQVILLHNQQHFPVIVDVST